MTTHRLKLRRDLQKKHRKGATLNLVSLMDIFTILVFFLMVNSSEVDVLETSTKIKLPDSVSDQRPENRLVVSVSQDDIVVQGRPVADVPSLVGSRSASSGSRLDYRARARARCLRRGSRSRSWVIAKFPTGCSRRSS
jgi:hypothetical protein